MYSWQCGFLSAFVCSLPLGFQYIPALDCTYIYSPVILRFKLESQFQPWRVAWLDARGLGWRRSGRRDLIEDHTAMRSITHKLGWNRAEYVKLTDIVINTGQPSDRLESLRFSRELPRKLLLF